MANVKTAAIALTFASLLGMGSLGRAAAAQPTACTGPVCPWTLPSGGLVALIANVSHQATYTICRTDQIRTGAMAPGSVVGLLIDSKPLVDIAAQGTNGPIAFRPSLIAIQAQSCATVTAKTIAVYRTDASTAGTDVFGTFKREDDGQLIPTTSAPWRANADNALQFEPSMTSLLFRLARPQFALICREKDSGASGAIGHIGFALDGKILELPYPDSQGNATPPNPPTYLRRVSILLHEGGCANVEASTLHLLLFGGIGAGEPWAVGTYGFIDVTPVKPAE